MTRTGPIWLSRALLDAVHDDLVHQFGGASGINSDHLIESALSRPWNLHAYGGADVFHRAAAYAFGIAKNRGYTDGNECTGFTAALHFLRLNGWRVLGSAPDAIDAMVHPVTDQSSETGMAQWLRAHSQSLQPPSR